VVFIPESLIYLSLCKFSGFHRGVVGDSILLGHDTALLGNQFLKNFEKMWGLQNISNQTPSDMASYDRKMESSYIYLVLDKYLRWLAFIITVFIVSPNKLTSQTIIHTVYRLSMAG
jgi:hypothetical protein